MCLPKQLLQSIANGWARRTRILYAHMSTSSIKPLLNFKLLILKVVFCTRVGFKKYSLAMISYINKYYLPRKC